MLIVGFDLGKRKSQLCVLDGDRTIDLRVNTERTAIGDALAKLGGKCRILIEASTSSEWVARWMESLGHDVVVADPNFLPMYARSNKKVKTDKRDARALAEALRLGAFRVAVRRDDENIHLSALLTVRQGLVKTRASLVNRVKALMERWGYRPRGNSFYIVNGVRELELPDLERESVEPLLTAIDDLTKQIKEAEKPLARAVKRDATLTRMDAIYGVGTITALAVKTALADPSRFSSASQASAYLGLVPSEQSSGEKRVQGSITKVGNRVTRSLLVEAAWCIMRSNHESVGELKQWALRIAERRGKQKAAVALARKLSRIMFAMWRDNAAFRSDHHTAAKAA